MLFLCAYSVHAVSLQDCTDEDGPKNLSDPVSAISHGGGASNKTTTVQDYCVHAVGGIKVNISDYVREWYCDDTQLKYKDFKCQDWGFIECYTINNEGRCRGYSENPSELVNGTSNEPIKVVANCGNSVIEPPEDCDPPGNACLTEWGGSGACSFDCSCYAGAKPLTITCGDGNITGIEECETDSNCTTGFYCSNCKCLKGSPPTENVTINVTTNLTNATANTNNITEANLTNKTDTNASVPLITGETTAVEATIGLIIEEKSGVRITSGITHLTTSIFKWLWGLIT